MTNILKKNVVPNALKDVTSATLAVIYLNLLCYIYCSLINLFIYFQVKHIIGTKQKVLKHRKKRRVVLGASNLQLTIMQTNYFIRVNKIVRAFHIIEN